MQRLTSFKRYARALTGLAAAVAALLSTGHAMAQATVTPAVLYSFPLRYNNSYLWSYGALAQGGDDRIFIGTTQSLYLNCGELLALNPLTAVVSKLPMSAKGVGCQPRADLVVDGQGAVWGIAATKGPGKHGALFKIPTGGAPVAVHAFTATEGYAGHALAGWPDASLRMLRLYVPQRLDGQIERYAAPDYAPEVLHRFVPADGLSTPLSVTSRGDGFLYGLSSKAPLDSTMSVFRMDPAGNVSVVSDLSVYGQASGNLADGGDGFFYLSTYDYVGASKQSRLLKIAPGGSTTVLHRFADVRSIPRASPVPAPDGWLYGTTAGGGTFDQGVIYRLRPDGSSYQELYAFEGGAKGGSPWANLMLARDGRLYGRTRLGGKYGNGVVFRFDRPAP